MCSENKTKTPKHLTSWGLNKPTWHKKFLSMKYMPLKLCICQEKNQFTNWLEWGVEFKKHSSLTLKKRNLSSSISWQHHNWHLVILTRQVRKNTTLAAAVWSAEWWNYKPSAKNKIKWQIYSQPGCYSEFTEQVQQPKKHGKMTKNKAPGQAFFYMMGIMMH